MLPFPFLHLSKPSERLSLPINTLIISYTVCYRALENKNIIYTSLSSESRNYSLNQALLQHWKEPQETGLVFGLGSHQISQKIGVKEVAEMWLHDFIVEQSRKLLKIYVDLPLPGGSVDCLGFRGLSFLCNFGGHHILKLFVDLGAHLFFVHETHKIVSDPPTQDH